MILCGERRGALENFRGVASGCPLFRGKNVRESAVGMQSVRCLEFRGGRFSEVANILHKRDFQSVTATLSAIGSVSASRSVCSGRFYCTCSSILSLFDRAKVPVETQSQVILARRFTGEEAQRAGIVHEVCPAADVTDRALAAAATLTRGRPHQRLHREVTLTAVYQME